MKSLWKEISDYQKQILTKSNKQFMCTEKLLLDYHPKIQYVTHHVTLKCYLKLSGFKIENIHYIIRSKQTNYMKEYIELNHKLRCETTDKNNKSRFKLMSNSLCGRTLLNKEKYNSNIKIISDINKAKRTVSNDTFKDYDIIDEHNVLFNIQEQCIKLDSPCYIGSCILDLF